MRGRFGSLMNHGSIIGRTRTTTLVSSSPFSFCCAFSSSSSSSSSGGDGDDDGGGRGRGSGRGSSNSPSYNFVAPTTDSNDDQFSLHGRGHGHGRGRGKPLPSSPFNSFVAPDAPPLPHQPGLSRGRGGPIHHPATATEPKRPIFLTKDESTGATSEADFVTSEPRRPIGEKNLPHTLFNPLPGTTTTATATGRGKPDRKPLSDARVMEENRHLRPRQPPHAAGDARAGESPQKGNLAPPTPTPRPKLSREEAIKKAVGILSKGDDVRDGGPTDAGGGRRGRGTKSKDDSDDEDAEEDDTDDEAFIGNDADGEKFAQKLGPELMSELAEAFEDMSVDVLPDPELDEYTEAFDTNLKIELEPEYLMGDFETNPDLHENPPIPLAEALEKMKPFLMAYEGIESQEEWEEVIKDTMERVPLLKEIVDHYCGPDRVTAKQQREELERVAKTIPPNVPNSVKRFTDRAVLSLQSNPGWGFHRKWQFMDKLVDEISKSHN